MSKIPHDTPMMRQYLEAKAAHPEAIVLMRMGDFYEAFLEDAEALAKYAGVALTSRNKDADNPVAMAGVPHHSLQTYLPRLLAAGKRVAIVDQLEDPKEAKGLVKRGLTRVITAGTLIDESGLEASSANYLVALTAFDGIVGIAALDISTGRFTVEEARDRGRLAVALAGLSPAEIVVPDELRRSDQFEDILRELCAPIAVPPIATLAAYAWKGADARRYLGERLHVASLDGFQIGVGDDHLAAAAAAALRYADAAANPGEGGCALKHVRRLVRVQHADHLVLNATCRRNLDLLRSSSDQSRVGTLLAAVDRTRTAPGARLLAEWLSRPLLDRAAIAERHDAVAWLVADDQKRDDARSALGQVYDLERLLARIATGRCHARDLVHLATTVSAAGMVADAFGNVAALPKGLAQALKAMRPEVELIADIQRLLVDDPPLAIGEGGMVRDGVDADLDHLRSIRHDASDWLAAYQAREAEACGLKNIKVGYNKIYGYYIELSKARGEKAPAHFMRKQTLVNAERYITPELKEFEDQALSADERIRSAELGIFTQLRERTASALDAFQACGAALSTVDVLASFAEVARKQNWCRPIIDDSYVIDLRGSRHPVVEDAIGRSRFVANDCVLDADSSTQTAESPRIAVITGPNMAGKSTFIRQVALVIILGQAGAYVPATAARFGIVDRVFTRVGAGDELARGQSTFMVEMAETAAILNHATSRSLVVLDEVGRGTSTYDGVSLAWAITEYIHDRLGCRTLFATHYHELVDLSLERPGIGNLTVSVAEQDDDVVFLHRMVHGAATRSYGIHVARLAGVPQAVITRAKAVLATLEHRDRELASIEPAKPVSGGLQLTLFAAADSPVVERLRTLELDGLSPRQALDVLYELQNLARRS
jgi:DNA mismatch repair protein MutS